MFGCQSCMRRCLQGLVGDSATIIPTRSTNILSRNAQPTLRRRYATPTAVRAIEKQKQRSNSEKHSAALPGERQPVRKAVDSNSLQAIAAEERLQNGGMTKSEALKELAFLKDPLKLGTRIKSLLRENKFEKAQALVRTASTSMTCTVSWNYLIDWQMEKGKPADAVRSYNEMKKRAQVPDAYTFTTIFRGLANHAHASWTLQKALSIFHSMSLQNSAVQPNSIHINAVLKVCARAHDLDAMFGITAKLPERGIGAPSAETYTTIINAIRQEALRKVDGGLSEAETLALYDKTILQVRQLWDDILRRWKSGDILIDQTLVCCVGRVLILGNQKDMDDVFSLIEQTMNIPRQSPPIVVEKNGAVKEIAQRNDQRDQDTRISTDRRISEKLVPGGEFAPLTTSPLSSASRPDSVYPKPGRQILSLLIHTCQGLGVKKPMPAYWHLLTNIHGVTPDAVNYHDYLRFLRIHRASTQVLLVVQSMPPELLSYKTFRIALSACVRDKLNYGTFATAGKLLDLMQTHLPKPDLPSLNSYLECSLTFPTPFADKIRPLTPAEQDNVRFAHGKQILRALERLGPAYLDLKSFINFGEPVRPRDGNWGKQVIVSSKGGRDGTRGEFANREYKAQALQLARAMIGAYDRVMNGGMVAREEYGVLMRHRSKLDAFVFKLNNPGGNRAAKALEDSKAREAGAGTEEAQEVEQEVEVTPLGARPAADFPRTRSQTPVSRNDVRAEDAWKGPVAGVAPAAYYRPRKYGEVGEHGAPVRWFASDGQPERPRTDRSAKRAEREERLRQRAKNLPTDGGGDVEGGGDGLATW